jgi:putative hydrolase of the HAD superfamily
VTAEPIAAPVIAAVTVDLDDTIFPQSAWLEGAWEAVAAAGGTLGLDAAALHERLVAISAAGSDGGRIIDRALVAIGCSEVDLPALTPGLLAAFRAHAPKRLECYPGVVAALASLRAAVPVACITDGDPHIQRSKLRALGLADAFDAVVFSDELGRQFRKPHPAPFLRALELLGVDPSQAVHVGDRPAKDVAGPEAIGMRAIRVRSGEYADLADDAGGAAPWQTFDDAASALAALAGLVAIGAR